MNNNIELTLILNAIQNPSGVDAFAIDPNINWTLFYKLILRHRVWHLVRNALSNCKSDIPITTALANHCEHDKHRIVITAGETIRIAREFTKKNIEHCFVKGTILNEHLYGALNTRPCRDIDVWVNADTYADAVDALITMGYKRKFPTYELKGFKERWYMNHKHDLAFYHPGQKILVELHFRLSYLGMDFFPMQDITHTYINLFNVPIRVPDNNYHLLYLMIHGAIHAWIRLRWLQDIALFINNNQCDLQHVYELAKQINCEHIVDQTLILVNDLFRIDNPVIRPLLNNSNQRGKKLAATAHQFITADYEMIDGIRNIRMFIKYRIYLAKLTVRGKKLHAIFGDLFKIDELFSYVTLPEKLSCMYFAIYPIWVIKYILKSIRPGKILRSRINFFIKGFNNACNP